MSNCNQKCRQGRECDCGQTSGQKMIVDIFIWFVVVIVIVSCFWEQV